MGKFALHVHSGGTLDETLPTLLRNGLAQGANMEQFEWTPLSQIRILLLSLHPHIYFDFILRILSKRRIVHISHHVWTFSSKINQPLIEYKIECSKYRRVVVLLSITSSFDFRNTIPVLNTNFDWFQVPMGKYSVVYVTLKTAMRRRRRARVCVSLRDISRTCLGSHHGDSAR